MITKIWAVWALAFTVGAARPGDLDRCFAPELRAWVVPEQVTLAVDGKAWIGGGFEQANGIPLGDLVKLGIDGGVESEPAPGYLGRRNAIRLGGIPVPTGRPFLLTDGGFLLPTESDGWLKMSAAGLAFGSAFPDQLAGEKIHPLFEREGKLWVIRQFVDGRRVLERQADTGFSLAVTDLLAAVPGPDGSVWVLAGELDSWDSRGEPVPRRVFRVDATGNVVSQTLDILVPRALELVAGPAGSFRLVYGLDQSRWGYWPKPEWDDYRIEWYSAAGVLSRTRDFRLPVFQPFAWAEAADGSWVATNGQTNIGGSSSFSTAKLRRYRPDGLEDPAFNSPGAVRSVRALAGGKWLVDGLRRLSADGSEDASWTAPEMTRSAEVKSLLPLPGGRVLAGGNFASADGLVRNRLVVFRREGQVDPTFVADERIEEWGALAVNGDAIYVVTTVPVAYGAGCRSTLVKLGLDGVLDETYEPQVPGHFFQAGVRSQTVDNVRRITAMTDGGLLVETSNLGRDVITSNLVRLEADGSQQVVLDQTTRQRGFHSIVALPNGGFVGDGAIYRRDASLERDLAREGVALRPLCQWRGGVLFLESGQGTMGRLRLWRGGFLLPLSRAPGIANVWNGVTATAGDQGELYVSATWMSGRAELLRLSPSGQVDRSFRAPTFGIRERQKRGNWWKAGDMGKIPFDPAAHEISISPTAVLWQAATRQLWTGGEFNVVGGKPRSGLARLK